MGASVHHLAHAKRDLSAPSLRTEIKRQPELFRLVSEHSADLRDAVCRDIACIIAICARGKRGERGELHVVRDHQVTAALETLLQNQPNLATVVGSFEPHLLEEFLSFADAALGAGGWSPNDVRRCAAIHALAVVSLHLTYFYPRQHN